MAISNKGEGRGLEEARLVMLRGCVAAEDMAPLPAPSGAAWHIPNCMELGMPDRSRVRGCRPERTHCKHDACSHSGRAHGPMAGRCIGARCWMI